MVRKYFTVQERDGTSPTNYKRRGCQRAGEGVWRVSGGTIGREHQEGVLGGSKYGMYIVYLFNFHF
jgi:hypothetical protein